MVTSDISEVLEREEKKHTIKQSIINVQLSFLQYMYIDLSKKFKLFYEFN